MFRASARALFVVLLLTTPAVATVTVSSSFTDIVSDATLIARGHVTDVRSTEDRSHGVETLATVALDQILKGDATPFVTIRVPGGLAGRYRSVMIDAPVFSVGQQAVFFLKRDPERVWRPVGLGQGVYRVQSEPVTGRPVIAPPVVGGTTASTGPVVRGDARRKLMSIPEFESLVRVVVARRPGAPLQGGGR